MRSMRPMKRTMKRLKRTISTQRGRVQNFVLDDETTRRLPSEEIRQAERAQLEYEMRQK